MKDTLITIYSVGSLGATTMRGKLVNISTSAPQSLKTMRSSIEYVPSGKRLKQFSSAETMLVLIGHSWQNAPPGLVLVADGSRRSRYGTYDKRYVTDFNKWANRLKASVNPDLIVIDQREYDGETDPVQLPDERSFKF